MGKFDLGATFDLAKTVLDVLDKASEKSSNSLEKKDVPKIAPEVTKAVEAHVDEVKAEAKAEIKEVKADAKAIVDNATNQEPWYQSRVVVGTGVALLAMVAGFAGREFDVVDQNTTTDLILKGFELWGAAYALYGRLFGAGKKPLGA